MLRAWSPDKLCTPCVVGLDASRYDRQDTRQKVKLLFDASTELRVTRRVDTESEVVLGPNTGASITAADMIVYVQGSNGGAGEGQGTRSPGAGAKKAL